MASSLCSAILMLTTHKPMFYLQQKIGALITITWLACGEFLVIDCGGF